MVNNKLSDKIDLETFTDKAYKFRKEIINTLVTDKSPKDAAKIILHLIPSESFSLGVSFEIEKLVGQNRRSEIEPIKYRTTTGQKFYAKYNFKGFRVDDGMDYVQLYRNGIIETVMNTYSPGEKRIYYQNFENPLLEYIPQYLVALEKMKVKTPIFLFVTLAGIKDYKLVASEDTDSSDTTDSNILYFPASSIENYNEGKGIKKILIPIFKIFWNAFNLDRKDFKSPK